MTHLTLEQFAELGSASADLAADRFKRKLASKFTEGDTEADIETYEALLCRFGFVPATSEMLAAADLLAACEEAYITLGKVEATLASTPEASRIMRVRETCLTAIQSAYGERTKDG